MKPLRLRVLLAVFLAAVATLLWVVKDEGWGLPLSVYLFWAALYVIAALCAVRWADKRDSAP